MKNVELVDYSRYIIYEDGRVFSKYWGKFLNDTIKPLKRYIDNEYISINGDRIHVLRHDLIWYYYNGEIPEGMEIDHIIPVKDGGNPKALSNLRLVTHSDNMRNPYTLKRLIEGNIGEKNPMFGVKLSDERKKEISEQSKRLHKEGILDKSIPVDQIDIVTGEVIKSWKSATECSKETNFKQSAIQNATKGGFYDKKRGKWHNIRQHKGFIWKTYKK